MDIPIGIGLQLAQDASKFHRENLVKPLDQHNISKQYLSSPPKPSASLQSREPSEIETQKKDKDYFHNGQVHKSVELDDDGTTNMNYEDISDSDNINT